MNSWRPRSTFQKLVLTFLLLGVLPLFCVCLIFLRGYEVSARLSLENTMEEANYYAQSKVEDLIGSVDQSMEYLYDYAEGEYTALYEVLESDTLTSNEKKMYVGVALDHFLQSDKAVSAAHLVTPDGTVYSRFYSQQKSLRESLPRERLLDLEDLGRLRQLHLLPQADEGAWCNGSTDQVLTLARNYMDTRSLHAVTQRVLATLYVDVRTAELDELLGSLRLGERGNAAIVDGQTGQVFYRLHDGEFPLLDQLTGWGGSVTSGDYSVYYQYIGRSPYQLAVAFDRQSLYGVYTSGRALLFVILAVAMALVFLLGLRISGRISKPVRSLSAAMARLQQGDLTVRVDIPARDEMGRLGEGFNRMVEELGDTIQEVYVAELCQRNAELNALKMQIQPHYLYNTLDVIRMSALEEGEHKTARLIESLSCQLRYIMGDHRDRVSLRRELDALREYAVLVEARYEGRIHISIEARDEDLDLQVLKLLLQPFVENAIKHGLRDRPEGGTVLVEVSRQGGDLQIVILNDGAPIDPLRLEHIRDFLAHAPVGRQDPEGVVSVGMKNTFDRIRINCGANYGFTIDSDESMGVIVTMRLPVWEEETHVEDPAGG